MSTGAFVRGLVKKDDRGTSKSEKIEDVSVDRSEGRRGKERKNNGEKNRRKKNRQFKEEQKRG